MIFFTYLIFDLQNGHFLIICHLTVAKYNLTFILLIFSFHSILIFTEKIRKGPILTVTKCCSFLKKPNHSQITYAILENIRIKLSCISSHFNIGYFKTNSLVPNYHCTELLSSTQAQPIQMVY